MKVSTENDNNFGYEKITIVVDNIPLIIGFSNDITTFTNEYDSFLFIQQYDSGKDQKKLTGVYCSG
jgi:hypothetical protein